MSEEKTDPFKITGLLGAQIGHRDQDGDILGWETLPGFLVESLGAGREAPDPEDDRPRPYAVSVNRGPDGRNFWSLDYDLRPSPDGIARMFETTGVYSRRPLQAPNKPVPRWKRVLDRGLRLFLGV